MKIIILMSTMFALMTFVMMGTSSCNKYERNPAEAIVGDYIGSGTDQNEFPFILKIVRVTKISKNRVKVEPVGHSGLTAFEIDVIGIEDGVASVAGESPVLLVEFGDEGTTLGVTTSLGENFVGEKQ